MDKDKFRFRVKQGKIQVQKLVNEKWKSRTLTDPKAIYEMLCPGEDDTIVSESTQENKKEEAIKGV